MNIFDYVMVLASVVIGLTLTHLLQGVARLVQQQKRHPVYWVHLIWIAILFVTAVLWWWWEFRFSAMPVWTFCLYVFVLCFSVVIYYSAALLLPDTLEGYQNYKDYYYARRGWIYGLNLVFNAFDLIDTLAKGTEHFASLGWQYPTAVAGQCILSVAAIIWKNEKVQAAAAIFILAHRTLSAFLIFQTVQ